MIMAGFNELIDMKSKEEEEEEGTYYYYYYHRLLRPFLSQPTKKGVNQLWWRAIWIYVCLLKATVLGGDEKSNDFPLVTMRAPSSLACPQEMMKICCVLNVDSIGLLFRIFLHMIFLWVN